MKVMHCYIQNWEIFLDLCLKIFQHIYVLKNKASVLLISYSYNIYIY